MTDKRNEMPEEVWAQFTRYDEPLDEIMVDAYDHEFSGGVKYVRADLSPPVPDDVDLRHVIDRMRDTITWLNAAGLTVAAEDAETLIRAASTPSADTIAVPREALQGVRAAIDGLLYGVDLKNGTHAKIYRPKLEQALATLDAVLKEGKS